MLSVVINCCRASYSFFAAFAANLRSSSENQWAKGISFSSRTMLRIQRGALNGNQRGVCKLLLRTLDLKIVCNSNVRGRSEVLKAWGTY